MNTAALVRDALAAARPGHTVADLVPLGEGLDHAAYLVDGELVVRVAKREPEGVRREGALLDLVGGVSPVPVPRPVVVDARRGCLAYPRLPGVPLLGRVPAPGVAARLGALLAALHRVPHATVGHLVERDDTPLSEWRDEAARHWAAVAAEVPAARRRAVEAALAAPPPPRGPELVFSHNDLGAEHVLVDPGTGAVTGVIDWSDAALTDPAVDLGLVLRDLGDAACDAVLARLGGDRAALRERAAFYARCRLLEDWAYGLAGGPAVYADRSRAAVDRLFP